VRSALAVLAFAYLFAFASGGMQLPLTSTAMSSVGLSMESIGLMWGARSLFQILGPTLWGVLADRTGDARPFGFLSLASGAVVLAILAFTTSPVACIALFGAYGLLAGSSSSILDGMTLTALGDKRDHYGRWRMWGTIGFGATALGSALLIDRGVLVPSPGVLFPLCAAFTALGGAGVLLVPKLPREKLARAFDVIPLLRRRDMLALAATGGVLWSSHSAYASFLTPLAAATRLPEWSVGASIAAAIVLEVVMLRATAFLGARFGTRNVLLACAALTVVRWVLLAMTTSPPAFIALNALHGVTFGLFYGTLVGLIAKKAPPEMRQSAQGIIASSSFGLGGAFGSVVCGAVLERAGAAATWWTMAAIAAFGFFLAWRTVDKPD
jgi:PPP family 3-phenylpropionic acid transporter